MTPSLAVPFHVVLVTPEIPPNTGNIARLCAVTGCRLHLIEPLGFQLTARELRRAGLDYWDELDVRVWPGLATYRAESSEARHWWFTTKGTQRVERVPFALGDHLCFGPETRGLASELLQEVTGSTVRIPMRPSLRSMNLSSAAAIGVYAALGRVSWPGLE